VGSGFKAQEVDSTIGFIVSPKDYRVFKNEGTNFYLDALLSDPKTQWSKKKKAFGTYVFNLEEERCGFFVGKELVGTGDIIKIEDHNIYIILSTVQEYDGVSILVKYYISTDKESKIDFACWWYDEESDSIIGEVSEKIEVDFVEKD
jgi:hypothetical protein